MIINNENEQNMQERLEAAIRLKKEAKKGADYTEIWMICHKLAEAKYQPAMEFFLKGLNDSDWSWRVECLRLLGFHYEISTESEITRRVRKKLASDKNDLVRMTAADVLGLISALPDQALENAVASDSDWFVRRSAYFAILQLAGVSYELYLRERDRFDFETQEIEPALQDIKRILEEEGIEVPANTFGSVDLNE